MPEEFFKWINEHYHTLFLLIIGGGIVFAFMKVYFEWAHRIKKVEEECNRINDNINNNITTRLNRIEATLDSLTVSVQSLARSFNSLIGYLSAKDPSIVVVVSRSPIELNDMGQRILIESGGKDFADIHMPELLSELDQMSNKTAFDVQTNARVVVFNAYGTDAFNGIKNYLYKNPYLKETPDSEADMSKPLNLETINAVIAVYLRNKYLEIHPELNPTTTS